MAGPGGCMDFREEGRRRQRGTQESNLALRFWRPPCYRYTSPPGGWHCRCAARFAATQAPSAAATFVQTVAERYPPAGCAGEVLWLHKSLPSF